MSDPKKPLKEAELRGLGRIGEKLEGDLEPVRLVEDDTGDRLLIYSTEAGVQVQFRYARETLWMTQSQIAELFGRERSVVTKHIARIFDEGELDEVGNVQKMHSRESNRPISVYSLDVIISVGYRVSSKQATMFRRWATDKLVQFATKGFVIDKERLKHAADSDRIKELREIIRDIRASEANVYREVRQICAICSDYDPKSEDAHVFYATMQNRLLWAVTSRTGPEIIVERADANSLNMGLQTWPKKSIRKADTEIAHNYMTEAEIREKNRLTVMLLDFFENRLEQGKLTTMREAEHELNRFITFNDYPLLEHKGSVKRSEAIEHAHRHYEKFDRKRRALRQETP